MVDNITPTYRILPSRSTTRRRDHEAQPVEPHVDDKQEQEKSTGKPFVERRKQADRRAGDPAKRPVYDMRNSHGRRRSDRDHPSIELDV